MPEHQPPQSSLIRYQTEDDQTCIQCRFEHGSLWLTLAATSELFQITVPTLIEQLGSIFLGGELDPRASIRKLQMVRPVGSRPVHAQVECYSLPAILALGERVRSPRVTQFRAWATARLNEYLVQGFVIDDKRLRHPRGKANTANFEELLEAILTYKGSFHRNRFSAAALVAHAVAMSTSNSSPTSGVQSSTFENRVLTPKAKAIQMKRLDAYFRVATSFGDNFAGG